MANKNMSFKLSKNWQDKLMTATGRTGATAGGFMAGAFLGKTIEEKAPKVPAWMIEPLKILAGIGMQVIDNPYAEAFGQGMATNGVVGVVAKSTNEQVRTIAQKIGLSGPESFDSTPAAEEEAVVDWAAETQRILDMDDDGGYEEEYGGEQPALPEGQNVMSGAAPVRDSVLNII